MKEKRLEQFKFSEDLKEKIVILVLYKKHTAKDVARMYDLPNVHKSSIGSGFKKEFRKRCYNFASHAKAKARRYKSP